MVGSMRLRRIEHRADEEWRSSPYWTSHPHIRHPEEGRRPVSKDAPRLTPPPLLCVLRDVLRAAQHDQRRRGGCPSEPRPKQPCVRRAAGSSNFIIGTPRVPTPPSQPSSAGRVKGEEAKPSLDVPEHGGSPPRRPVTHWTPLPSGEREGPALAERGRVRVLRRWEAGGTRHFPLTFPRRLRRRGPLPLPQGERGNSPFHPPPLPAPVTSSSIPCTGRGSWYRP